jgi:hypothetical protein
MTKDISENEQEVPEGERKEYMDQKEENKEWKDIIKLPDDLDFEVH